MSLKMMKKTLFVSAIVAMGSLAVVACGDSGDDKPADDKKDSGTTEPDDDKDGGTVDPGPKTRDRSGFLVAITAQDTAGLGDLPCQGEIPGTDIVVPPYPVLARDEVRHVGDAIAFGRPSRAVAAIPGERRGGFACRNADPGNRIGERAVV